MRVSLLLCAAAMLVPGVLDAQIRIRPGQYEFTVNMDLGLPKEAAGAVLGGAGFKNHKKVECLTDDVRDANDVVKLFAEQEEMENCKIADVKTTGNKMTYTMTCLEDDVRMTMHTEMTFGVDSFTSVAKGDDGVGHLTTVKTSARRIGECPK